MRSVRHVVYLHGFVSSPASSKARRFETGLAARGVGFTCPDLNQPEFETLTVTRMLAQTREAVARAPSGPVALVGSSLGGFVAVHAAAEDAGRRVDRLVLLAPAFDFGGNRLAERPTGSGWDIEAWRRDGSMPVFHYAWNEERRVGFDLYRDAAAYDAFAVTLDLPVLIFQGRRDDVVDPGMVEQWAAARPNVELRLLDDDHQLGDSVERMWEEAGRWLGVL